jgi:hypothetical protein
MQRKVFMTDRGIEANTSHRPKDATRNGSIGVRVLSKDRKEGVGPHAGPMYIIEHNIDNII